MNAGGGAWHQARLLGRGRATGFQLWVAMPPVVEDAEAFGQYIPPDEVPRLAIPGGELLVLLGEMRAAGARASSPIQSHQQMNYFVVKLDAGVSWRYSPPPSHDLAWAFVFDGEALVQGEAAGRDLLVLDAQRDIQVQAAGGPAKVLVGTAVRHPYALVTGPSSVHTQRVSLAAAQRRIRAIADRRKSGA